MPDPTITQASQVIVNKMTQAQYEQITPSDTEFYLITDGTPVDDFVGADGTNAGSAGLVPAPTATDNTKYLKGDGTWAAVDSLPSQTSQSGKFLTTNGTSASWSNVSQLENQNSNENLVKVWTGTKAEYDEIGTYFAYTYGVTTVYVRKTTPTTSDTVYSAVGTASALTISSVSTGSITLSDSNVYVRDNEEDIVDSTQYGSTTMYNIKDDTDTTLSLLNLLYPVGSIYIGTMQTCPLQTLGVGTWQLKAADRVLQGAGTRGSVGTTVNESLPNITGEFNCWWSTINTPTGAFIGSNPTRNGASQGGDAGTEYYDHITFNASSSSSTYQNDAPVQQDAYIVNIWERIS